eukprot:scaffold29043_cov56-Cyclotella_meneghiniana.AAC.1
MIASEDWWPDGVSFSGSNAIECTAERSSDSSKGIELIFLWTARHGTGVGKDLKGPTEGPRDLSHVTQQSTHKGTINIAKQCTRQ